MKEGKCYLEEIGEIENIFNAEPVKIIEEHGKIIWRDEETDKL